MTRHACALLLLLGAAAQAAAAPAVLAQGDPPAAGILRGVVTALGGEVLLPGAVVRVDAVPPSSTPAPAQASGPSAVTDERGRFQFAGLPPGRYRVVAALDGFVEVTRDILMESGIGLEVTLDLQVAGVTETVQVQAPVSVEGGATLGAAGVVDFTQLQAAPAGEVSIDGALPLVPGVIHGPAGVSIKGGRPTQAAVQLGSIDLADASTGDAEFRLPSNAVGSLEVLPSPYAVEFGRFSAGVTLIHPRKGGDRWRASVANINPAFRTKRGQPTTLVGIESFSPRIWLGGPVVKDRLFLAQSLQYRFSSSEVRSRPEDERTRTESGSVFTRLDARPSDRHAAFATVGFFPERVRFATLGTFVPPETTPSVRRQFLVVAAGSELRVGDATTVESVAYVRHHDVSVRSQGSSPMVMQPQGLSGHAFHDQDRNTWTAHLYESVSTVRQHLAGTHFLKAGMDVAWARLEARSVSRQVELRRDDGTLVRRLVFGHSGPVDVTATDVTLFAQDRWQPADRVLVDAGVRWDRSEVLGSGIVSPRLGVRVHFDRADRQALTVGVGRFVERTPLTLAAPAWVGERTVTDSDTGTGPFAGERITRYEPRLNPDGLRAPRALTWHAEYHARATSRLSFRAAALTRETSHEYVIAPEHRAAGAVWLTIDSRGRSAYRELTLSGRYAVGTAVMADVSYVRASGHADVNSYAAMMGTLRRPIIRPNAYARSEADVPHRVVGQLRGQATRWRGAAFFEFRSGLPYSAVDARQDYVGEPFAAGRLPALVQLDVIGERRVRVGRVGVWVGLQVLNALDRYNPRDVQDNVDSAAFGTFYNAEPRRVRVTVRF